MYVPFRWQASGRSPKPAAGPGPLVETTVCREHAQPGHSKLIGWQEAHTGKLREVQLTGL
jgi:hypothetical protein